MTEITKYICDMCGKEQELNTYPEGLVTNYVQLRGMIHQLDKKRSIEALCPSCAGIVGNFIMKERKARDVINSKDKLQRKAKKNKGI